MTRSAKTTTESDRNKTVIGKQKPEDEKVPGRDGTLPTNNEAVISGTNGIVLGNGVSEVDDPLAADEAPPHPDSTSSTTAFAPTTAIRAGQIISSKTSLSKELQSKLPRLGEVESNEKEEIPSREDEEKPGSLLPVEVDVKTDVTIEGEREREGDVVELGERDHRPDADILNLSSASIDMNAVVVSTISTNVQDLPEDFSAKWKMEEEEKKRVQEEGREERRKVRGRGTFLINPLCV